jgi:hypothetical protein
MFRLILNASGCRNTLNNSNVRADISDHSVLEVPEGCLPNHPLLNQEQEGGENEKRGETE